MARLTLRGHDFEEISAETLANERVPIRKLVNALLKSAIEKGASVIYIEPHDKEIRVRCRIDGTLYTMMSPPLKFRDAITERVKEMSQLDLDERWRPQQGRIGIRLRDGDGVATDIDCCVSCQPTSLGENIFISLQTSQ